MQTHPRRSLAAVAAVVLVGVAAPQSGLGSTAVISDLAARQIPRPVAEASSSWVAEPLQSTLVRAAPRPDAPVIGRITPVTPYSMSPSGFLTRGGVVRPGAGTWVRILLAQRPNGVTGWVPAGALILDTIEDRIVVRLAARRVEYWRRGTKVASFRAGIGTAQFPTPRGRFAVEDRLETRSADRGMYGPYIITLTAHSNVLKRFNGGDGQIAIHGSESPGRVGRPSSQGCVILADDALRFVWQRARAGTPVDVIG